MWAESVGAVFLPQWWKWVINECLAVCAFYKDWLHIVDRWIRLGSNTKLTLNRKNDKPCQRIYVTTYSVIWTDKSKNMTLWRLFYYVTSLMRYITVNLLILTQYMASFLSRESNSFWNTAVWSCANIIKGISNWKTVNPWLSIFLIKSSHLWKDEDKENRSSSYFAVYEKIHTNVSGPFI